MTRLSITTYCLVLMLLAVGFPVNAQDKTDVNRINKWFDDQKEKQKSRDEYWKNIHVGPLQKPGEIQKAGTMQKPGAIEIPKGWKAIKSESLPCERRFTVSGDTLFDFDKSTLTPHAVSTLNLLVPELKRNTTHPVTVEGHTDSIGADTYNERLSFKRAETVKNWLSDNKLFDKDNIKIKGYGKNRPIAPNTNADGSDNPPGRQLNRRVEIIINTCVTVQPKSTTVSDGGDETPEEKSSKEATGESTDSQKKSWIDDGSTNGNQRSIEDPSKSNKDPSTASKAKDATNQNSDGKDFQTNTIPLTPPAEQPTKFDAVPAP